jgi:hypothetical protein
MMSPVAPAALAPRPGLEPSLIQQFLALGVSLLLTRSGQVWCDGSRLAHEWLLDPCDLPRAEEVV